MTRYTNTLSQYMLRWHVSRATLTCLFLGLAIFFQDALLFGQSRRELEAEMEVLERSREVLEGQYWALKQKSLKDRERITDNLATLNSTLSTIFERRNSLNEELFLVQGNLNDTRERRDLKVEEFATFGALIKGKLEADIAALRSDFPSELERNLLILNRLRELSEQSSLEKLAQDYFDHQEALVARGSQIEVYTTDILNEETGVSEEAKALRVGFIHSSYTSENQTGYLIRTGDIAGTGYEWKEDLPGGAESSISSDVLRAYNRADEIAEIDVIIDPTQSGNRVRVFFEDNSSNIITRFLEYFRSGGFMMYPLSLVAFGSIFISIERIRYFRKNRLNTFVHADKAIELIRAKCTDEAEALIHKNGGLVERLFAPFFKHTKMDREEGERLLEETISGIIPLLNKRLTTLAVLGSIAPLLGLLGTVSGMIALFDVITLYGNNNPQVLAGGISIALVTTQTGLSLAVPIILGHHILTNYKTKIIDYFENIGFAALEHYAPVKEGGSASANISGKISAAAVSGTTPVLPPHAQKDASSNSSDALDKPPYSMNS